ncbi:hypothetical protein OS493_039526, partial [Desmophyllum pertusum]
MRIKLMYTRTLGWTIESSILGVLVFYRCVHIYSMMLKSGLMARFQGFVTAMSATPALNSLSTLNRLTQLVSLINIGKGISCPDPRSSYKQM